MNDLTFARFMSTALVFQSQQGSLSSFEKLLTFEQSHRGVPD
jgi:hypothetical protein